MNPRSEFGVTAALIAVTYSLWAPRSPCSTQNENHLLSFQRDIQNTQGTGVLETVPSLWAALGPSWRPGTILCVLPGGCGFYLSRCKSPLYYIYCQHGAPEAPDPTPEPRWAPPPAVLKKVFNLMAADSKTTTDTSKWTGLCDSSDSELAR